MKLLHVVKDVLAKLVGHVSWNKIFITLVAHALISWALLSWAGEPQLSHPKVFGYWYITTITTVGFGDYSPETITGRYITGIWVMFGGIALATSVIGKLTSSLIEIWRRRVKGMEDLSHFVNHSIIVGWHGRDTRRIIEIFNQENAGEQSKVVLVASEVDESPLNGTEGYFVKSDGRVTEAALIQSGIRGAKRVLIYGKDDDDTQTMALMANRLTERAHIVAHFMSSEVAKTCRHYAPGVECSTSLALENLVHAAFDPGSSELVKQLLSISDGQTQFITPLTLHHDREVSVTEAMQVLKGRCQATMIGYQREGGVLEINPAADDTLRTKDRLFYIAKARLSEIDMEMAFAGEA